MQLVSTSQPIEMDSENLYYFYNSYITIDYVTLLDWFDNIILMCNVR